MEVLRIRKSVEISAAHKLSSSEFLACDSKCVNMHGHNYTGSVEILIESFGALLPKFLERRKGILLDYSELKKIAQRRDHTALPDDMTVELLCREISVEIYHIVNGYITEYIAEECKNVLVSEEDFSAFLKVTTILAETLGSEAEYTIVQEF